MGESSHGANGIRWKQLRFLWLQIWHRRTGREQCALRLDSVHCGKLIKGSDIMYKTVSPNYNNFKTKYILKHIDI